MHKILTNDAENAIVHFLSESFPHKASEIHKELDKRNLHFSYKYVYKSIQNLLKKRILSKKGSEYMLNKTYISELKSLVDVASKNYEINQNVFLTKLNSSILSIINEEEKNRIYDHLLSKLNEEIVTKLDEWYSAYYDPKKNELKKILKEAKITNKEVLELGCGTGRITLELAKRAKQVTAIDDDQNYLDYLEQKIQSKRLDNIKLIKKNINNIGTLKKKYDVIVSGWAGLHYADKKKTILKSLHKLLKPNGILIIIEAYSNSDYIKVLNTVRRKESQIIPKQKELKDELYNIFGNVREEIVDSYYIFPDIETAEETFRIELVYEEGIMWTKADSTRLRKALNKLKNPLKISEPPKFYICKKVN